MRIDLELLIKHRTELEQQLESGAVLVEPKLLKKLSKEHSYVLAVHTVAEELENARSELIDVQEMLKIEKDLSFSEVLQQEKAALESKISVLEKKLKDLLIPPTDDDDQNTIVEIRAGAGGQEAMLFAAEALRMYQMYADRMGWKYEILSSTPSDLGGVKECVVAFTGKNVWRYLQFEGGTHRVQRVPATEAQGRIHTSTITIAVLPDAEEGGNITINEADLRIETTRSSGAGGQHVNKTDSAVRITHIPSGIAVFCQEERSQHKNRDKAFRLLSAKLQDLDRQKVKQEQDQKRSQQIGTADRSEKIRTYNFPQSRVTDHRINLTKHNLDQVLNGDLDDIAQALVSHFQQISQENSLPAWIAIK